MDFSHIISDDPTMRNVVSDQRFERKPTGDLRSLFFPVVTGSKEGPK